MRFGKHRKSVTGRPIVEQDMWELVGKSTVPLPDEVVVLADEARRRVWLYERVRVHPKLRGWLERARSVEQWEALVRFYERGTL